MDEKPHKRRVRYKGTHRDAMKKNIKNITGKIQRYH